MSIIGRRVRGFLGSVVETSRVSTRSIALYRVALALVVLCDLVQRCGDMADFHGRDAVLSVEQIRSLGYAAGWSLAIWDAVPPVLVFVTGLIAAGMMALGCATRFATTVTWVAVLTIQARMPFVNNGGDMLLRLLLLWSIGLPLGARLSIDSLRRRRSDPTSVASPATLLIVVQLAAVYVFSGLAKCNSTWFSGEALQSILSWENYARPAAEVLTMLPGLLRLLTWSVLALELVGPMLLFVPGVSRRIRVPLAIAFISLHIGIETTLTVGLFSRVCCAAWLLLLPDPATWWGIRRLGEARRETDAEAGSRFGTWIDRVSSAWSAMMCVVVVLLSIESRIVDEPIPLGGWEHVVDALAIDQAWDMFDRPPVVNTWTYALAERGDASVIDVGTGETVLELARPPRLVTRWDNHRHRKFDVFLARCRSGAVLDAVADFRLRRWNASHAPEQRVQAVQLILLTSPIGAAADDWEWEELAFVTEPVASMQLVSSRGE